MAASASASASSSSSSSAAYPGLTNPFLFDDLNDPPFKILSSQKRELITSNKIGTMSLGVSGGDLQFRVASLRWDSDRPSNIDPWTVENLGNVFIACAYQDHVTAAQLVRHGAAALRKFQGKLIATRPPHQHDLLRKVGAAAMKFILESVIVDNPAGKARTMRFWDTYMKVQGQYNLFYHYIDVLRHHGERDVKSRRNQLNEQFNILKNVPQIGAFYLEAPDKLMEMQPRIQHIIREYYLSQRAENEFDNKMYSQWIEEAEGKIKNNEAKLGTFKKEEAELKEKLGGKEPSQEEIDQIYDNGDYNDPRLRYHRIKGDIELYNEKIIALQEEIDDLKEGINRNKKFLSEFDEKISAWVKKDFDALITVTEEEARIFIGVKKGESQGDKKTAAASTESSSDAAAPSSSELIPMPAPGPAPAAARASEADAKAAGAAVAPSRKHAIGSQPDASTESRSSKRLKSNDG